MWSALAALWVASPIAAYGLIAIAVVYYALMSVPLAVGMLALAALMVAPLPLARPESALDRARRVRARRGSAQFVGHAIEGRKPKFLQDLQFLLIGPAWLLQFVYRAAGIRY